MKSFFREMKEPLMTFALYPAFIQASGLLAVYHVACRLSPLFCWHMCFSDALFFSRYLNIWDLQAWMF